MNLKKKENILFIIYKNLTKTNYMFYDCDSLSNLDLSHFNSNNVIYMNGMLSFCNSLKNLNLSNFNTQYVTQTDYMFYNCNSLKKFRYIKF